MNSIFEGLKEFLNRIQSNASFAILIFMLIGFHYTIKALGSIRSEWQELRRSVEKKESSQR